jgi:hypothetical protein
MLTGSALRGWAADKRYRISEKHQADSRKEIDPLEKVD